MGMISVNLQQAFFDKRTGWKRGVRFSFEKRVYGFTVVFYRYCGEGWGWTADDGESENETKSAENKGKNVYLPNGDEINGAINPDMTRIA